MLSFENFISNTSCIFNNQKKCTNSRYCDCCPDQPDGVDKKNGKNPPVPLTEIDAYGGPVCPACGEMPYSYDRCVFCGQKFSNSDDIKPKTEVINGAIKSTADGDEYITCSCGSENLTHTTHSDATDRYINTYICKDCGNKIEVVVYRKSQNNE